MRWYLIEWQESDGNDCTVFDTVLCADSEESALNILGDAMERQAKENSTELESDGNHLGYYFPCSDDCSEGCEGHGGTSLRSVETFATEADARAAHSFYHTWWEVSGVTP